jgi:hypothetical protein
LPCKASPKDLATAIDAPIVPEIDTPYSRRSPTDTPAWWGLPPTSAWAAQGNLARLLKRRVDGIFIADYEEGDIGPELFRAACKMGLDGRCKHWLKVKNRAHPAYSRVRDAIIASRQQAVVDQWKTSNRLSSAAPSICKHVLVLPERGKSWIGEDGRMKNRQVREGQIVRVVDGPFTGFRGEVKEVDEQTSTVKMAVQVFGRVTPIALALGQIERVPKNSNWGGAQSFA